MPQPDSLAPFVPPALTHLLQADLKTRLPKLAKHPDIAATLEQAITTIPTRQHIIHADARHWQPPESSIHLVLTSPPYWDLKAYPTRQGQLGLIHDYREFLDQLLLVWKNSAHALIPGGRLICVVGDVCLSRRRNNGRHTVIPLHADIQRQCQDIGLDNLAPILWHKISNAATEASRTGRYLGKPYEPGGIIKNDIEFILMFRKPGAYRRPSQAARILSLIPQDHHRRWFQQVWTDLPGLSTRIHPAPFPIQLAERLIRMFSFAGDTVYDPFAGTGTTLATAAQWGRNGIGLEIEPAYCAIAEERLGTNRVLSTP